MTLPSDGKPLVLTPGGPPVLVTEYAFPGVLVINTATAGRVWLGTGSAVGPQNGTPLEAGTGAPWNQTSQLWAVLDPAATAPVTIILTGDVARYDPSPAAIAAAAAPAIAAQLLAQGIPNVLTQKSLWSGILAAGASTPGVDVSAQASAVIQLSTRITLNTPFLVTAVQTLSGVVVDTRNLSAMPDPLSRRVAAGTWRLPIVGDTLTLTANAGNASAVNGSIAGTNRPVNDLSIVANDPLTRIFDTGTVAMTAGTSINLPAIDGTADGTLAQNGQIFTRQYCAGTGGSFGWNEFQPDGTIHQSFFAKPAAAGEVYVFVAAPRAVVVPFFIPTTTTAAGRAFLEVTKAGSV